MTGKIRKIQHKQTGAELLEFNIKFDDKLVKKDFMKLIRDMNIKHLPFLRWYRGYTVTVYPCDSLSLFLLRISDNIF